VSNPLSSVALVTDTPLLTHPAVTAVVVLEHGLDELAAASLWSLSDTETLALRERLEGVRARLDARVLAGDLDTGLGATAAALAAGGITREQAAAIAAGMRGLPRGLDPGLRAEAETFLLEQAGTSSRPRCASWPGTSR